MTTRKMILSVVLLAHGWMTATSTANTSDRPPNVVFILVDDLGYMDIGAYNAETFYETPNVDRLAETGMRFTNGYAANPVCSPTRFSIMTGRYPSRVDATNFFSGKRSGRFLPAPLHNDMPLDEITLAESLRSAGYATFFAGKWHLGPNEEFWPTRQGFDINMGGHVAGGPFKAGKYFSPYGNPRLQDGPKGEHLTARLADETVAFIKQQKDQPFLAYLAFYTVHTPLMAPQDLVAKYKEKAARLGLADRPAFSSEEQVWETDRPRRVRTLQAHETYAAMVESMDRAVGKVLNALDEQGLRDNTIVCFTSDNGGLSTSEGSPTSNLPLRGGKGWLYEGGIREPFIIRVPGVTRPGSVCDEPVMSIDFHPTINSLVGIETNRSKMDGKSLVPLLEGQDTIDRDSLYWHYPHYSNQGGFPGGAIRMGGWKLIERYEDGRVHLYNLKDDIGERTDLAATQPERVNKMRNHLHNWYEAVDAKFLTAKQDGPPAWRPQ